MRKVKKKLDIQKRKTFNGFEKNIFLGLKEHYALQFSFFPFFQKKFLNEFKFQNRCVISGNPRSVSRKFKLNRFTLKQFISFGYISGVKRASW